MASNDNGVVNDDIFWPFRYFRNFREKVSSNAALSADVDQQETEESRIVAAKAHGHDAVVKFDTYRNLHLHRADLPAEARLSCINHDSCGISAVYVS